MLDLGPGACHALVFAEFLGFMGDTGAAVEDLFTPEETADLLPLFRTA